MRKPSTPLDPATLRRRAMDLLARREHAALELRRKLEQRGFDTEDIQSITADLQAENLLSDARCAEAAVRAGIGRGHGPLRLRAEMERRGISEQLADRALDEAQVDWRVLAAEVRRKRFGADAPEAFDDRARQTRFLRYRGFTSDQIRAALERS